MLLGFNKDETEADVLQYSTLLSEFNQETANGWTDILSLTGYRFEGEQLEAAEWYRYW
jgi:hypothetical protein